MQKQTLLQRFVADTPKFERIVQLLSVLILAALANAAKLGFVPQPIFLVLTGWFGGIALICQFAAEDLPQIEAAIADPSKIGDLIADLSAQFGEVKQAVLNPPVAVLDTTKAEPSGLTPLASTHFQFTPISPDLTGKTL